MPIPQRHPIRVYIKTAADKAGKLTALQSNVVWRYGRLCFLGDQRHAQSRRSRTGPLRNPKCPCGQLCGIYQQPVLWCNARLCATQVPVAYEQQIDLVAEQLGMNPYEIRMKNILRQGSMTANGQVMTSPVPLEECLQTIWDAMNETEVGSDDSKKVEGLRSVGMAQVMAMAFRMCRWRR